MAMKTARYIGADGDDNQLVHMAGQMFVKGQWTQVDDGHEQFARLSTNPTFEVKGGEDRDETDTDDVAELERVKAELRGRGVAIRGNPKLETLQAQLADLTKDEDAPEVTEPDVSGAG